MPHFQHSRNPTRVRRDVERSFPRIGRRLRSLLGLRGYPDDFATAAAPDFPIVPAVPDIPELVTDTGIRLRPDATRVITRFFVPGREDVGPGDSRAAPVIERILALDESAVAAAMRSLDERFSSLATATRWTRRLRVGRDGYASLLRMMMRPRASGVRPSRIW